MLTILENPPNSSNSSNSSEVVIQTTEPSPLELNILEEALVPFNGSLALNKTNENNLNYILRFTNAACKDIAIVYISNLIKEINQILSGSQASTPQASMSSSLPIISSSSSASQPSPHGSAISTEDKKNNTNSRHSAKPPEIPLNSSYQKAPRQTKKRALSPTKEQQAKHVILEKKRRQIMVNSFNKLGTVLLADRSILPKPKKNKKVSLSRQNILDLCLKKFESDDQKNKALQERNQVLEKRNQALEEENKKINPLKLAAPQQAPVAITANSSLPLNLIAAVASLLKPVHQLPISNYLGSFFSSSSSQQVQQTSSSTTAEFKKPPSTTILLDFYSKKNRVCEQAQVATDAPLAATACNTGSGTNHFPTRAFSSEAPLTERQHTLLGTRP